jgi:hypothetical protein
MTLRVLAVVNFPHYMFSSDVGDVSISIDAIIQILVASKRCQFKLSAFQSVPSSHVI